MNATTTFLKPTTAAAISRKLQSIGFDKFDGEVGFECFFDKNDAQCIAVIDHHFGDTNQVARELHAMGYDVMEYSAQVTFVYGKVAA